MDSLRQNKSTVSIYEVLSFMHTLYEGHIYDDREMTLEEVMDQFQVSTEWLNKTFQRELNLTPQTYLKHLQALYDEKNYLQMHHPFLIHSYCGRDSFHC